MTAQLARVVAPAALLSLAVCGEDEYACTDADAQTLFDRRIAPLLDADNPTSCNECHLAGVDLGLYLQATPCATMACMVERGVADLDAPEDSLVLDWILRATPGSPLITESSLETEHDAMLEWIEYNARCGASVCEPMMGSACGGPAPTAEDCLVPPAGGDPKPWDDPGDCSDRTLESMFQAKVYGWRGRCFPCHASDHVGEPLDAPRWIVVGDCNAGSLATMRQVLRAGYVDREAPERSLLLLKPLAESAGGVEHGGGDKFHDIDDSGYLDFKAWIDRYIRCTPPT